MRRSGSRGRTPQTPVARPQEIYQVAARLRPGQATRQRTILGLLSENGQYRKAYGQCITTIRCFSGSENVCPPAGKKSRSNCVVHLPTKQGFSIYIDKPERGERRGCGCTVGEQVEYGDVREAESKAAKPDLHFLLDFSTASPMVVDTSLQSQLEDRLDTGPNVINVPEYAEEIHRYLREVEMKHRPKAHYMQKQPDITEAMRTILVDWLVEVGEEYKLRAETLYLAINYLDRFLSCMSVLRGKLQLVGTAAILLASKYEEIYPPEVDEFVYITDDTYTKRQLLRMEHLLLKVLAFDLAVPTTNQFLLQYLQRQGVCLRTENLAKYVAELSLLETDPFLKYVPSLIAAAAYCLANYIVNQNFWPETLAAFTGYSLREIGPCLNELHRACLDVPHRLQQAIREKYKAPKYMHVSLMEPPVFLPLQ
ncbi:cyclin-A1 isoform X2 [Ornithorhynchus anatinus]|uniref:cyclin-A1 isoform X2 n=1 Tax=Ornithorhynchus anatinus TaxID=9258 RepID=UPI0010A76D95|nr:cyclin-A1 isoform X2 [Ornithorhynchus anatinus]